MSEGNFFADGFTDDGRIRLRFRPKPKVPVETDLATFEDIFNAKASCAICGGDCYLVSHRNFVAEPPHIEGAAADVCQFCSVRTPGLRSYGKDKNITYRDAQIVMTATALSKALEREAKHVRR